MRRLSRNPTIADSALHEQLLSMEHLVETVDNLGLNRRGVVTARRVARCADGLSESGGESKARALMIERGWQTPELQVELFDPVEPGRPYRVDYLWRVGDRLIIGEFDGFVKSEKAAEEGKLRKGAIDERQRESRLSMLDNCKIVRLCWDRSKGPDKARSQAQSCRRAACMLRRLRALSCTSVDNRTHERGFSGRLPMSAEIWTDERGKTDVCNMSVDNLPFLARKGAQSGRFSTLVLWGAARQRLDADDVG